MRVVGVVGDFAPAGAPDLYVPLQQRYWPTLTILARRGGERSVPSELRAIVASMDPDLPVLAAAALDDMRNGPVETQLRVASAVAGSMGGGQRQRRHGRRTRKIGDAPASDRRARRGHREPR
jgi:hypothetical protein